MRYCSKPLTPSILLGYASRRGCSQFDPQSPANSLDGVESGMRLGPERLVERFAGQSSRLRDLGHASSASYVPQRRGQEPRISVFDGQPDVVGNRVRGGHLGAE